MNFVKIRIPFIEVRGNICIRVAISFIFATGHSIDQHNLQWRKNRKSLSSIVAFANKTVTKKLRYADFFQKNKEDSLTNRIGLRLPGI
jgi:hypothetical protein